MPRCDLRRAPILMARPCPGRVPRQSPDAPGLGLQPVGRARGAVRGAARAGRGGGGAEAGRGRQPMAGALRGARGAAGRARGALGCALRSGCTDARRAAGASAPLPLQRPRRPPHSARIRAPAPSAPPTPAPAPTSAPALRTMHRAPPGNRTGRRAGKDETSEPGPLPAAQLSARVPAPCEPAGPWSARRPTGC
jgi:hypothetical protein